MDNIKYSIVIIANNEVNLVRTLESIVNQDYNLDELELIIENINDNLLIDEIIEQYTTKIKITYVKGNGKNLALFYNDGLKRAQGKYITFIDSSCFYKNNLVFKELDNVTLKHAIVSINSSYYDSDDDTYTRYKMQPKSSKKINLTKTPCKLSLNFNSYFFKLELLKGLKFDRKFNKECQLKFLIDVLDKRKVYYYCRPLTLVTSNPFEDNTSKNSYQYDKDWYTKSLTLFSELVKIRKRVPRFHKELLMYLIYSKINCNVQDRNKGVLNDEEVKEFFDTVADILLYIDDRFILQYNTDEFNRNIKHNFSIPRWIKFILLESKINKLQANKEFYVEDNGLYLHYYNDSGINNTNKITKPKSEKAIVYTLNYKNGKLCFDCGVSIRDFFMPDDIKINVYYNGVKQTVVKSDCYPLLRMFGKTVSRKYLFSFKVTPRVNMKDSLKICYVIDGKEYRLKFKYANVHAKLSNSKWSFWHCKNLLVKNKVGKITIEKASIFKILKCEVLHDLSKLKNVKDKKIAVNGVLLRIAYYLTKPFYKHVWLTWDKLYKAGDNGEYMYQYALKEGKNIYYLIKEDSPDFERLRKQNKKHVLIYNSFKAKLLSLHAEAILDTHANVISYCGFNGAERDFAYGLFDPEIICIQHGLTIQKIAQFQNRLFDNIKHYCCASQFEVDNISEKIYGYSKDQISLTGLARYDGLKNNDQKLILITPTWRRNVVNSSVAHIKKKHNNNFKNSDYFKIYNSFINNQELIECAKKNGYRITFLLHPAMSGQLEDYDKNDYVDIIPATGDMNYEKILTEASLMVTDYSGVQFDFAYQRKVLVYYHPDKLPPHYDAGGLDYKNMGFGPVCTNEKTIVNELCEYMNNGCKIKDKYKNRADSFFAFNDFNNCKRILKTVEKYLKGIN